MTATGVAPFESFRIIPHVELIPHDWWDWEEKTASEGYWVLPGEWTDDLEEVYLAWHLHEYAERLERDTVTRELARHLPADLFDRFGRIGFRVIRRSEGVTQDELAAVLGVTKPTVSRWEKGRREPNHPGYLSWLRHADRRQGERHVVGTWQVLAIRDGWTPGLIRRYGVENHWHAVFKTGGLLDKWTHNGTLPHFTPADAGFDPADIEDEQAAYRQAIGADPEPD